MKNKETLSLGLFLVCVFLIGIILFSGLNREVNITLENGNVITSSVPINYSFAMVIFLIVLSCLGGISFYYYVNGLGKKIQLTKKQQLSVNLLEGSVKIIYLLLLEKGSMLQKDVVYESGFSKVKVSRILDQLDRKKLIRRISYGNTNKVEAIE